MRLRTDSYIVTGSIGVSVAFFFPVVRPLVVGVLPDGTVLPVPFVALVAFGGAELMPLKVSALCLYLFGSSSADSVAPDVYRWSRILRIG